MTMCSTKLLRIEPPKLFSQGVLVMAVGGIPTETEVPVSLEEFTIEPHTCSELGESSLVEIFRILSGRGAVLSDRTELRLEPGDWVLVEANTPHQVRNDSAEVLRAVSLLWPERMA
jgi:mannose-6-phosphate isomerase-like protein (cupin superfamily)